MGYSTYFNGRFVLNKPLDEELYNYLIQFSTTRHIKRDLPPKYGVEGEFYIDKRKGFNLRDEDSITIIDHNHYPSTQPGFYCCWEPSDDRCGIEWNQKEKFYTYIEWLEYIIKNFLAPKNYILNGTVEYEGEKRFKDRGRIIVIHNEVSVDVINQEIRYLC